MPAATLSTLSGSGSPRLAHLRSGSARSGEITARAMRNTPYAPRPIIAIVSAVESILSLRKWPIEDPDRRRDAIPQAEDGGCLDRLSEGRLQPAEHERAAEVVQAQREPERDEREHRFSRKVGVEACDLPRPAGRGRSQLASVAALLRQREREERASTWRDPSIAGRTPRSKRRTRPARRRTAGRRRCTCSGSSGGRYRIGTSTAGRRSRR